MFYVIRHGLTDWNKELKLQGSVDVPLNAEGREMARAAREEYRDVHFDICFVSPLIRARETAELLLEGRDIEIITDERLREMNFGDYEGTSHLFDHPELPIYKLFKEPENYVADQGAESLEELYARTGEFLRERVKPLLAEGKDVLIVGHGAMNSSIINQIKQVPIKDFWSNGIPNCKLFELGEKIV